ncbi:ATP-dependent DNA helicase RecG [Patescibacteria group bacterium]|nr:ATP-dependent DNA helicase RecG [Patescibacteria group bacterium]MBU1952808.1 ATP-dependent DNA helicase RecG [Patescibacteria group bacterium]
MIKVESPVSEIPKIGPRYKEMLEKLEIFTVEDLLYYFPFRYDDFSIVKTVGQLKLGDIVTVRGILGPVENIFTKYGKGLTRAKFLDHTGEIELIWFNQTYLKKSLNTGKNYSLSGKVGTFNNKLCFISPELEQTNEGENQILENVHTGRLVPIYPTTYGITSKWIRGKVKLILNSQNNLEEFLPEEVLKDKKFKDVKKGIESIHFPKSEIEAKENLERFAFEELFIELLNVEKKKHEWSKKLKGNKFKAFEKETTKLVDGLPFKLTNSQKTALSEILGDLQKSIPMNRLLEGDVGTGKTILAIVASYLAHINNLKTLYMAPTEILANQHFETFNKILKKTNMKVELETGSKKKKSNNWDVLVGTHALLFAKDKYKDIGLVVIDEQHRFGVEQRGKIMGLTEGNLKPHLLTMTATPIPRTLALTLYGDLSISVLKDFPFEQRRIITKVVPKKMREQVYRWIKEKNEPTFIVCPLISESESETLEEVKAATVEFENLTNGIFKGIKTGLLHGRMRPKEKEEVVKKFRNGEIKILVSTPVIEVGIDVPDAAVIVIESAERYGLASLHQLRGRVGRSDKEGYCFTFMSNNSRNAYKRLKYLEECKDGIKLAEKDLETRGQGDIFGITQHGFKKLKIADLGNLKMLEEAKICAQRYYPKLSGYPRLSEKLTQRKGRYITTN